MAASTGRWIEGVVPVIDAFENDAVRLHIPCDVQKLLGDFTGGKIRRLDVFRNTFVSEIVGLDRKEDLALALADVHDFTIFG